MDAKYVGSDRYSDILQYKNKKCICSSVTGFLLVLVAIITYAIDPVAVISRYCLKVDNGTRLFNKLHEKVDTLSIKMYLFNITNYDRFRSGLDYKLKLEEVGPFTYRETRYNTAIELDTTKNILRYTPFSNVTFIPEESIADPKDVVVHVPNIIFLSFASQLSKESFWVRTAFEIYALKEGSKAVLTLTAEEYFWGYDEPLTTIASTLLPGIVFYNKLGLLDYSLHPKRNVRLEVDISEENKFQVKTSKGLGGIAGLGYKKNRTYCNSFTDAYEGYIYPSHLTPERKLRIYHNFFCRLLALEYAGTRVLRDGTEALHYTLSRDTYEPVADNDCLCTTGKCYRGLSDMSSCINGLPMSLSNGHFLDAEARVFDRLEGLKPDRARHGSEFLVHKNFGLALNTSFSIQTNVVMSNVNFSSACRPFSDMVVPYAWVHLQQLPLPEDVAYLLRVVGIQLPKVTIAVQVILVLAGCSFLLYTCGSLQSSKLLKDESRGYFDKESHVTCEKTDLNSNQFYVTRCDWK